jgi:hypothetical protein
MAIAVDVLNAVIFRVFFYLRNSLDELSLF